MKKILTISLAFLMMFSCVTVVFAEDTALSTALDLTAMETVDNLSTQGWAWDNETKTLTLDGLNLVTDTTPAINLPADATVILADGSVNSVTTTAGSGRGIQCAGSLTMKTADGAEAKGSLSITTGASGRGIMYRIDRTEVPTAADVAFDFSDVILNIDAQRGIESTFDPSSITDGTDFCTISVTMTDVELTHTTTKVNRVFSFYNTKGSTMFTLKNSTVNGVGAIYIYGSGTGSNTTTNIFDSTVSVTGSIYPGSGGKNIITNVEHSTVYAQQLQVGRWNMGADLARLNVDESTLVLGPNSGDGAALEVGVNGAYVSEAHLTNSTVIAIHDSHAALSISRYPTDEEKEQYPAQDDWTVVARGILTIENCEMLFAGSKDFGDLTEKANHEGSHVTTVLYPSATVDTSEEGIVKLTVPADTVIYTAEGVNYTTTEETVLTFELERKLMSVPAGTTLTKHTDETEETRTLDEDMTFILGESLKVVYDVTYTDVQVENGELYVAKGEDYIFTMPENSNNELNVTIGGVAYTNYTVDGNTVTIPGADITGDVAISLHSYKWETVKDATCGENGSKKEVCIGCGAEGETQEISATGNHTLSTKVVDADCTTAGSKTTTCANCDYKVVEVIAAKGHSYDSGVVTTAATCSAEGVKTFTCSECNATRTQAIPVTACVDNNHDGKCDICNEVMQATADCVCICHNTNPFIKFIYMIIQIIMRSFNIHRECVCGAYHW